MVDENGKKSKKEPKPSNDKNDLKGSRDRSRSKSISEPRLESVKEITEESTDSASRLANRRDSCPRFFGVRSYLHNFYDSVTLKEAHKYQEYEEYRYLIAPKRRNTSLLLWRFIFWLGLLMLTAGCLVLALGYLVPKKEVIITYNQEIGIVDKLAVQFNRTLDNFKVIGLAIFCIGGLLLSTALLLPSLVGAQCFEGDAMDETTPFKVRIGRRDGTSDSDEEDDQLDKVGIPATEQVKSVQPKREEAEAIVTGSGLTKLK
ncbi:Neurensin-1 [Halotydeus destructor]|nr:Neurensin-1 [Halotydeus destructor]